MSFIKKNKWFLLSISGILTLSSGLCIFGEALSLKNGGEAWFLYGTIAVSYTHLTLPTNREV